jgi:phage-related protein
VSTGPGDVDGGRLVVDVYGDTTGFGRDVQRRIDAETAKVRARIKAELDSRSLPADVKRAATAAGKAATITVKAEVDRASLQKSLDQAIRSARASVAAKIAVDRDAFKRDLDATLRSVKASVGVKLAVDRAAFKADLEKAIKAAKPAVGVRLTVDRAAFQAEVDKAVGAAKPPPVTVAVDANTTAADAKIEATARGRSTTIKADADTTEAETQLGGLTRPRTAPVKADFDLGASAAGLREFGKLPAIIASVGMLGGAVVSLAGGLYAMGAAASQAVGALAVLPNLVGVFGQAVGVAVAGFSGIGDAVKALGEAEDGAAAAATAAADQREAAADRVKAAQEGVAAAVEAVTATEEAGADAIVAAQERVKDAREAANDAAIAGAERVKAAQEAVEAARASGNAAIANASRSLESAEYSMAQAIENTRMAQEALTQAREDAKERIEDLELSMARSRLSEEAGALAVQRARERLNEVNSDPMSTDLDRKEADLAYRQALQSLKEIKEANEDLREIKRESDREGVKGSDEVRNARDRVKDALSDEEQAALNLANAQENLLNTQRQAAVDLADAQENVRDAVKEAADASVDAAERVKEAQEDLADTQERVAAANKAALGQEADARENLRDALTDQREITTEVTAAQQKLADAMDNLTPAGQRFAKFLANTLMPRFSEMRKAIQDSFLPPIQRGLKAAMPLLDVLETGLVDTADRLGGVGEKLGKVMGSGVFGKQVSTIMASNNRALSDFGDAFIYLFQAAGTFAVEAGPLLERFSEWVKDSAKDLRDLINVNAKNGDLEAFLERAGDRAAQLGDIVSNIAGALYALGSAGMPAGDDLMGSFEESTAQFRAWAENPENAGMIASWFEDTVPIVKAVGDVIVDLTEWLVTFAQVGSGSVESFLDTIAFLARGFTALLNSPVGPFIDDLLAIAGVAGALSYVGGVIGGIGATLLKIPKAGKKAFDLLSKGPGKAVSAFETLRLKMMFAADALRGHVAAGKTWLRNMGAQIKAAGASAIAWGKDTAAKIKNRAVGMAQALKAQATLLLASVKAAAASTIAWLRNTAAIVANRIAIVAQTIASKAAALAAKAWAAMQWALNAALSANPIALVVIAIAALVAGLVVAYKNSEKFREIVQRVWSAIKTAISAAWEKVIKPALQAFARFIGGTVIPAIRGLWERVVKPVFNLIGKAISVFWRAAKVVFSAWAAYFNKVLIPAIKFLWERAIKPVFDFISGLVSRVWNNVLKPIFGAIADLLNGDVSDAFGAVWEAAKTAFGKVVDFITGLPKTIANLATKFFNAGKDLIGALGDGLMEMGGFVADIGTDLVNWIIGALNDAIPNSLPIPGPNIDLPDNPIPELATGGRATGANLVVIGEGDEAETVLPDSLLTKLVRTVADAGLRANGRGGRGKRGSGAEAMDSKAVRDSANETEDAVDDSMDHMSKSMREFRKKTITPFAADWKDQIEGDTGDSISKFVKDTSDELDRKLGPAFKDVYRDHVAPAMQNVRQNVRDSWRDSIKPDFNDMETGIKDTWRTGIRPTLNEFGGHIKRDTATKVGEGVVAIGKAWGKVEGETRKPMRYVVGTVLNKGLISAFNKIAKFVSADTIDPISMDGWRTGGYTGPGAKDSVAGVVHRDEFVLRSEAQRKIEAQNPGALDHMNRTGSLPASADPDHQFKGKRASGPTSDWVKAFRGYREGGLVDPMKEVLWDGQRLTKINAAQLLIAQQLLGGGARIGVYQGSWEDASPWSGTSHMGPGVSDTYVASGGASLWDMQAAQRRAAIAAWARNIPGAPTAGSGAHIHGVSMLPASGTSGNSQLAQFYAGGDGLGGTDYGPNPPVLPDLQKRLAQFGNIGAIGSGGGAPSLPDWAQAIVDAPTEWASKLLDGSDGLAGRMGRLIQQTLDTLVKPSANWATSLLATAPGSGGGVGDVGPGAAAAMRAAQEALPKWGWGPEQWDPLKQLWMGESGWNVEADNPGSSAYGIPQALVSAHYPMPDGYYDRFTGSPHDKTFQGYGGDAGVQIKWGLDYIKGAYGSPAAAMAAWQSRDPHWYANGGWLAAGRNDTISGGGEAVLDRQQSSAFIELAKAAAAMRSRQRIGNLADTGGASMYAPRPDAVSRVAAGNGRIDLMAGGGRAGTVFEDGAIQMTINNPAPEPASTSVNSRMRALAAFGLFDSGT